MQHASEKEFTDVVESMIQRKVTSFVSGIDTRHDVSAEVFYLEPILQLAVVSEQAGTR